MTGQSTTAQRRRRVARRAAVFAFALLCLACAAVLRTQTTDARSEPTMNAKIVRTVARRYWQATVRRACPDGRGLEGPVHFHSVSVLLSTVSPHFAEVQKQDDGCTFITDYFEHRSNTRQQHWQVVLAVPDSAQYCSSFTSHVPPRVLTEFHIKAIRRGTTGNC
jgi:hypothetical protein